MSQCHCIALRRAAQALTNVYDDAMAVTGLTTAQYALMRAIERLEPVRICDLALATRLDRTTLGRNIDILLKADLVARGTGDDDGRERRVRLTPEGCEAIERAKPVWRITQARVEQKISPERLALLHDILAEVGALSSLLV